MLAKKLVYELRGEPSSCDACDIIKSKAKQIPRSTKGKVTAVGEIMGLDITGPFPITNGTNHRVSNHKLYWCSMIDHYSRKILNWFTHRKDDLVNFAEQSCSYMDGRKKTIETIRMDNAGENQAVKTFCTDRNINIKFTRQILQN